MNIAISVACGRPMDEMVLTNGIIQNCKFLYDVLEAMGHSPYFLYFNEGKPWDYTLAGKTYRAVEFNTVIQSKLKTPAVLEVQATLNPDHRQALRDVNGAKIAIVRLGNSYFMDLEYVLFHDKYEGHLYFHGADRIWLSPHFEKTRQYHESINQCPSRISPFIWEPDFISEGFPNGPEVKGSPDIYVMEANINVVKNALIPLCIISELYKAAPDEFGKAMILNGTQIQNNTYFVQNIIRNLPGTSNETDKVFFTGRYKFDDVFKRPDILLSFQWENALNYLLNEALYKGVPLVHNSPMMKSVGYYYEDCDIRAGVAGVRAAIQDGYSESIRAENRKFLHKYSIHNPEVQKGYADLLEDLCA